MKRINVVGTTGSGKSTVAASLAEILGYPCVHLDQLFWKPNWQETPDDELFEALSDALSQGEWVLDGNYSRTEKLKWQRVDTIVWLDFGMARNFFQLLRRTLKRAWTKEELWPNTGNRESFTKSFLSTDSILVWFFRGFSSNRKRYARLLQANGNQGLEIIQLKNPRQVKLFLESARNQFGRPDTPPSAER